MKDVQLIAEQLMRLYGTHLKTMEEVTGGLTNKTFLVSDGSRRYIVRIAGESTENIINRENELQNMKIGEQLGISPALYANFDGNYLMEYIDVPTIKKEEDLTRNGGIDQVVDVLYRLNTSGAVLGEKYSILKNIHTYKKQLALMGVEYPVDVAAKEQELYHATAELETGYTGNAVACHVDNIYGNIFLLADRALLIDWEYSGMTDVYNELVNFALLNDMSEELETAFLERYFQKAGTTCDRIKYYGHKMANNYMWIYWHLIQYYQGSNVEYNQRRWRERLNLALECKKKCEVLHG